MRFNKGFIAETLVWLILLLTCAAATPAQTSLPTAEGRASRMLPASATALRPASATVAGVDAVALTVADADAEAAFFSRVLSFEKVSNAEVSGDDYEHLEGVFGLRMRVVRMRLGDEFIELTEYLAPRDGKPYPQDARANDLWHWQTKLTVADADQAAQILRERKTRFVSSGVVAIAAAEQATVKSFVVRDPDGHAIQLSER